jgi:hypothetical protein
MYYHAIREVPGLTTKYKRFGSCTSGEALLLEHITVMMSFAACCRPAGTLMRSVLGCLPGCSTWETGGAWRELGWLGGWQQQMHA